VVTIEDSKKMFQKNIDKQYLKLKHRIYKKICKSMSKGQTNLLVSRPIFMDEETYIHIMAKIIVDFQKLGIQYCTPYGEIRFVWGNLMK